VRVALRGRWGNAFGGRRRRRGRRSPVLWPVEVGRPAFARGGVDGGVFVGEHVEDPGRAAWAGRGVGPGEGLLPLDRGAEVVEDSAGEDDVERLGREGGCAEVCLEDGGEACGYGAGAWRRGRCGLGRGRRRWRWFGRLRGGRRARRRSPSGRGSRRRWTWSRYEDAVGGGVGESFGLAVGVIDLDGGDDGEGAGTEV
jgi:hypothetical protein